MSHVATRPRILTTGGISRVIAGAFGVGGPLPDAVDPRAAAPIYAYHEGDVFYPGAGNFVFESLHELPVSQLEGGGGINMGTSYRMNAWPVYAGTPPLIMNNTVTKVGLGGLQAGAFIQQPLLDEFSQNE